MKTCNKTVLSTVPSLPRPLRTPWRGSHQPPVEEGYTRLSLRTYPSLGTHSGSEQSGGRNTRAQLQVGGTRPKDAGGTLTSRARTHAQLPEPIPAPVHATPAPSSQPSEPATRVTWGPEGPDEALLSTASQGPDQVSPRGLAPWQAAAALRPSAWQSRPSARGSVCGAREGPRYTLDIFHCFPPFGLLL